MYCNNIAIMLTQLVDINYVHSYIATPYDMSY